MSNEICKLPDYELHFLHLDTFLIQQNNLSTISNEIIGGMKEARVLDMSRNEISSLPQSLKLFTKLRMLNLRRNESLDEISILGELKDLENLILRYTRIKEIPQEIGQLVKLRLFDVSNCKNLLHISPDVLSKLRWLEDLCIGFYSMHEGIYYSLVEVMNLSKLTYLNLFVPCLDVIPEGFNWRKLNSFAIQIGDGDHMPFLTSYSISECHLLLYTTYLKIPLVKSLNKLIKASLSTVLALIKNLNNIMPDLYHEGFNKLESIELWFYPNVLCLVDWDKIQTFDSCKDHIGDEGKTEEKCFMKLKHLYLSWLDHLEVLWKCLVTLDISYCNKLVRVFSVSVAQGLVSLEELTISRCYGLENVIWDGDEKQMLKSVNLNI